MYSGITNGLFEVTYADKKPGLVTYAVNLNEELLQGLNIGASIAIDGVCQTVVSINEYEVTFNAMQETLDKTTICDMHKGRKVSVERSLRYGDEIGGHEVAGHVIGTALVAEVKRFENNLRMTIQCPKMWMKYIFPKSYIAIDGSSLTIGDVDPEGKFNLHLIPETLRVTNFRNKKVGDLVNVELDHKTKIIVDTVENILANRNNL